MENIEIDFSVEHNGDGADSSDGSQNDKKEDAASSSIINDDNVDQETHRDDGQSPANEILALDDQRDRQNDSLSEAILDTNASKATADNDGQSSNDSANRNGITEKLDRELALSTTHRLQLQDHWRRVLSKEKFRELHEEELPHLIQYHDETVKRKREVIHALQNEIASLQELYQDAMVANMNRMEDLIAIHDDQMVKLERSFRDGVTSMQSRFHVDVERINVQYEKEMEAIRGCICRQADEDECRIKALRQDHQHELEEIKNRNLEHVNSLRFAMDSKVEDLEEQFELMHGEFAQNTDGARAAYDQLKSREEQMRKEIESRTRQANKLQREIQRFQLIARQEEAQITERHEELLVRKARAIARWNMTQEEMSKFREGQQKRLVALILRANERKEALRRQCALADRVKKIASACQKWESSRERFASLLRESSSVGTATAAGKLPPREVDSDSPQSEQNNEQKSFIIGCMGQLGDRTHHFWNKFNMAKLDVLTLEKKVCSLKQREQDLKNKLTMYQNGITVNNDVLNDRNPLIVINGKMNAMPNHHGHPNKKRVTRRLTVVDGNHFFATNNIAQVA